MGSICGLPSWGLATIILWDLNLLFAWAIQGHSETSLQCCLGCVHSGASFLQLPDAATTMVHHRDGILASWWAIPGHFFPSSGQRIFYLMPTEWFKCLPSRNDFCLGTSSHKGLTVGIFQRWSSYWQALPSPRRTSEALLVWPFASWSPLWPRPFFTSCFLSKSCPIKLICHRWTSVKFLDISRQLK